MWNAKRPILIIALVCAGLAAVCSARSSRSEAKPKYPTAPELLDKYAETQDKLKSFILKSEGEFTAEYDLRFLANQSERRRGAGGYLGEVRSDGTRHYRSEKLWEKRRTYLPATKNAAQADPRYTSYLWDGKRVFQYQRSNKTAANDRLFLTPEAHEEARGEHIISTNRSRVLLGYFEDTFDRAPYNFRRIDNELKQAARSKVLQATEPVRGSQCYVIVAQTAESRYKLWIDPQHSFHIARAEITRGGLGVKFGNREEISLHTYLKNVRFQKFGNVWMPVEADWGYQTKFINNCFSRADYHHKIVEFTLSPDHKLLRSFETDEIRNGTGVLVIGAKGKTFTWQDGKFVDKDGREVMNSRPIKPAGSAESKPKSAVKKRPSAWELLRRYAEQQAKVTAPQSKERVVHFPKNRSIGMLYLVERPLPKDCLWHEVLVWERKWLGEAQGDVRVPADKMLRLGVGKNAWKGGLPFAGLKPDDIQILTFYQYPHASDSVLKDVARLTGLEVLYFGEGNFTERGLKHLTVLKQLKALSLPGRTHSRGLAYLSKLPSLEDLHFGGPMVTDAKMVHIGRLTSLTELSLGGSKVGKGLVHLKGLKSLWYLSLAATRNEHIDKHLAHLAELTNIEELDLGDTLVGDAGLEHLKGMIKLKKLNIGNRYYSVSHNITDAGMVHLNKLKSLEELTLSHTGVTDIGLAHLAGLDSLKKLNVGRGVTDEGMAALAKMKSLEDLAISSPHVTDAGMEKLTECPCLKSLALQGCPITNAGLARLAKLKTLTKLSLSLRRTQVTGSGLTVLKELPLLTGLNVHYMDFGELGMAHLAGLKSLERLRIDGSEGKITDDDLADLSRITSLKSLQIIVHDSSQSLITDQGLAHLANLKALEFLNISSCQKVTDAGLRHFEGLASLKRLRLDLSRITKAGIARLKAKIPGVEVIVQRAVPR